MYSNKKTTVMLITSTLVLVLLITIGLSFAYFTANIEGEEAGETITVTGGRMKIHYDTNDSNINITNVVPQDGVIATKEFTLTGDSTTNQDMLYQIHLVIVNNGFTDNAIQYKLTSVNDEEENGEVAPSITELKGIPTGENQEVFLGNATFESPTEFNVHSYTLEFYFPRGEVAENENQGKSLNAYVSVREGHKLFLGDLILKPYGGVDNISVPNEKNFAVTNTINEYRLIKMVDDYGDSYVFRGIKEQIKNNLIFAEHQWKIVRINGDGSIRIIYNGACSGNSCVINDTGTITRMNASLIAFNTNNDDQKYVGYMYGDTSGSYAAAHSNQNDSTIKVFLDNWYISNIYEKGYESYISDTLFCGDREVYTGTGFGTTNSFYQTEYRLLNNKNPSIKCSLPNDSFTVSDTMSGNGVLEYPIGLLTADEAAVAGLVYNTDNTTNYLNSGDPFWLMSPARYSVYPNIFYVENNGKLYITGSFANMIGVRGVLNLKSDTAVSGTGTLLDPYIVN